MTYLPAAQGEAEVDAEALLAALRAQGTSLRIHAGVAEAVRARTDDGLLVVADIDLGNYHIAVLRHGRQTEQEGGGGGLVVTARRRGAPYLLRQGRWAEASTLLDHLLIRDQSPETLAFTIPLLERIVRETRGAERALLDAQVLTTALLKAGRYGEAEPALRRILAEAVAAGDYGTASVAASQLVNLLMLTGHLQAALQSAEEMAAYSAKAGVGPWRRLLDEGQRLQVLNAMGRYQEVLERVEALRPELEALPEPDDSDRSINPWNVREVLLDNGRSAAMRADRWEQALALNAEQLGIMARRGAGALELARARFKDYFQTS